MRKTFILVFILVIFMSAFSYAGDDKNAPPDKRPKVGLVLSGGGAKGFAYIGLFRVLHELGLKIDYIGGTSIGSIMAALYASGYSPDAIEKMIRDQNWNNLLRDVIPRKYVAFEEKEFMENSVISFTYQRRKINLQGSLYHGQQVNLLLNRYLCGEYQLEEFKNLRTPFVCMGTDLLTGKAVSLKSGYLPMAVRASMSIPGYFSPTLYQGKYLVDGGVVDNFPAKQVKNMGAQFIIGGNVQTGLVDSIAQLNTITSVIDQIISFSRISANKLADSLVDYQIHYDLKQGMMDFDSYDSIIAYGNRVAYEHYDELKKLADSLNSIQYVPVPGFNTKPMKEIYIRNVIYEGQSKVSRIFLDNYFEHFENSTVEIEEIEEVVTQVYGTRFFEYVFYELNAIGDNEADLLIKLKNGAPGYISASLHYDNNYQGSIMFNGVFRNILGNRSKLFASVLLGPNPRFHMLYMISNGPKPGPGLELDFYSFKFNEYEKEKQINTIRFINYKASFFVNSVLRNTYSFRTGVNYEYFSFKPDISDDFMDQLTDFNSYLSGFASFQADSRNRKNFSTNGFISELKFLYVLPLGSEDRWTRELFTNSLMYYLKYDQNLPLSKNFTLKPGVFLGGTLEQDTPPLQYWYGVGGLAPINYQDNFVDFTGVKFIQSYGLYAAIGRLKLQYKPIKKFYLTLRSDAGANQMYLNDLIESENFMLGYGLTVGYDSFIGPVEVTLMGSNQNSSPGLFVNLGFDF